MEKNDILSGFIVLDRQSVDELDAVLWQMEHQKSGARLVWLERAEENKTFGIAFQTQPWDDTGVFHILEHSVLCGAERYPVKEQVARIGNSVVPIMAQKLVEANCGYLKVGERVPHMRIDCSGEQIKFA